MQTVHYQIAGKPAGSGEWMTLLHGASQHSGLFNAQVEHFGAHYRLLLIDLPGHGGSTPMVGPYGQAEYTQAVLAALDAVGVQRTHLWGTHTGAAISLLIASSQPQRVASLVLEGAVLPGMPMPYTTQAIARARSTAQVQGVAAARAEWFAACQWFDVMRSRPAECRADAHWQLLAEFAGQPWLDTALPAPVPSLVDKVQHLQHPTLLVNGELDVPEFLDVAHMLAQQMPRAQRATVAGAGGFPLWELPQTVNRLVQAFLQAQHHAAP